MQEIIISKVSKFAGVYWSRYSQKWKSSISENGVLYECGVFAEERDAAKQRDLKILELGLSAPLQIYKPIQSILGKEVKKI